jgi:hypothetical protein
VGTNSHDRDLRQARLAYIGAVRRLDAAMRDLGVADIPMDPGPGPEPRPWTARHVAVIAEAAAALNSVLDRRRAWDRLRQEWRPPH